MYVLAFKLFALVFLNFPRKLANTNELKIMNDPSVVQNDKRNKYKKKELKN